MHTKNTVNRRKFLISTSGLILTACGTSTKKKKEFALDEDPPPLKPGYQYHYQHQGPYPWSDSNENVDGQRVITVTGKMNQNTKLWRIEDYFENIDGTLISFVDDKYLLHEQHVNTGQTTVVVENTPPQPMRYLTIKEGEEKTFKIKQTIRRIDSKAILGQSTLSITTIRRSDIRKITEAGAFMCRSFLSRIEISGMILGRKSIRTATEESFWCDKIGWFVIQNYVFDPVTQNSAVIREGYETKSSLIAFNEPYGGFES